MYEHMREPEPSPEKQAIESFGQELRDALYMLDLYAMPTSVNFSSEGTALDIPDINNEQPHPAQLSCSMHYRAGIVDGIVRIDTINRRPIREYKKQRTSTTLSSKTEKNVRLNALLKDLHIYSKDDQKKYTAHSTIDQKTDELDFFLTLRDLAKSSHSTYSQHSRYSYRLSSKSLDHPAVMLDIGENTVDFEGSEEKVRSYMSITMPVVIDDIEYVISMTYESSPTGNRLFAKQIHKNNAETPYQIHDTIGAIDRMSDFLKDIIQRHARDIYP